MATKISRLLQLTQSINTLRPIQTKRSSSHFGISSSRSVSRVSPREGGCESITMPGFQGFSHILNVPRRGGRPPSLLVTRLEYHYYSYQRIQRPNENCGYVGITRMGRIRWIAWVWFCTLLSITPSLLFIALHLNNRKL